MRQLTALATGLALLLAAPLAMAKPTDPKAIEQGKRGNQLYAEGDFEGAKEAFEAGYEIEADAFFLYGIGQALNQLGDCKGAIRKYKQVKESPSVTVEMRQLAEQAMIACAEKVAVEDPADEPADEPDEDPVGDPVDEPLTDPEPVGDPVENPGKDRKWYLDPLGDTLVAFGVAGTGAGIGLLVAAQVQQNKVEDAPSYDEFDANTKKVRTLRIAGGATLGVGGLLLIGGAIRWAVLGLRPKRAAAKSSAHLGVIYDRSTAGLSLSGRF